MEMTRAVRIATQDNVAVALTKIGKGECLQVENVEVTACEDIPQGHKIALRYIAANEDIIKELIDLTDNFERAIKLDDNDLTDELSKFLSGFKIMYSNLTLILKKYGVEEINRVGQIFDPNQEEALLTDSVEGKANEEVLEVLLKGYKLKDKVIRPASVKVNIGK